MKNETYFERIKELTEEKRKDLLLNANCEPTINSHKKNWEKWLLEAFEASNNLDFLSAARKFRKIAADMQLLEQNISNKGNFTPKNKLNDLTGKQWIRHTKSWLIVDGTSKEISKEIQNHPASYPPSLAEHFISFFTKKGDWVLDAFAGTFTTSLAAKQLGRKSIGIEMDKDYVKFGEKRMKGNGANGIGVFPCVLSPCEARAFLEKFTLIFLI